METKNSNILMVLIIQHIPNKSENTISSEVTQTYPEEISKIADIVVNIQLIVWFMLFFEIIFPGINCPICIVKMSIDI